MALGRPPQTRLRIQLVGADEAAKEALAASLGEALRKRGHAVQVVHQLRDAVAERFPAGNVNFLLALESEYLRYESDRDTKALHLVFVDSIVDRFLRMGDVGVGLDMYFAPRLQDLRNLPGHLYLYGPGVDESRTNFMAKWGIQPQVWSDSRCVGEIAQAALIKMRTKDGK